MATPIQSWLPHSGGSAQTPFFLLAGPCAIEDATTPFEVAQTVKAWCAALGIPYVFKGSYRKANRTSSSSFTGIGDAAALEILARVRQEVGVPVVTDIHETHEAKLAAEFVDVLQIPAFLCRQTELLHAAGETGKVVNIKKGQFAGPEVMRFAAEKVAETGNHQVLLTERGTTFGYTDLVVDYRNFAWMQQYGFPVVFDGTHSLQQPNSASGVTGGRPQLIETLARAAAAVGVDGFFLEVHPEPSRAKSDAANMLRLDLLEGLLTRLVRIAQAARA
ncbi:MAG: 3-deoxy-8-phosphooctulonate synthase [Bacteroidia bacterium]|nr:3-deoxy-8-phosphooctulonate synthase [Bacteroidia bacterium]